MGRIEVFVIDLPNCVNKSYVGECAFVHDYSVHLYAFGHEVEVGRNRDLILIVGLPKSILQLNDGITD